MIGALCTLGGAFLATVCLFGWRLAGQRQGRRRLLLRGASAAGYVMALPLVALGVFLLWGSLRPHPAPLRQKLFRGVEYHREVRTEPRPVVIHVVTVDLTAPGVQVLATPGVPGGRRPFRARTTSGFVAQHGVQVAINANFFFPFHSSWPWDFYPHQGDPVSVAGVAAANGEIYSGRRWKRATLVVGQDGRVSFDPDRQGALAHAVSGKQFILRDGQVVQPRAPEPPNPVVAVGLDRAGRRMILVVADGRQPLYSEGLTLPELAAVVRRHGGHAAIQLDGGGSAALVIADAHGEPRALNSPIHTRIPGRERPVANHLGVRAQPLSAP